MANRTLEYWEKQIGKSIAKENSDSDDEYVITGARMSDTGSRVSYVIVEIKSGWSIDSRELRWNGEFWLF